MTQRLGPGCGTHERLIPAAPPPQDVAANQLWPAASLAPFPFLGGRQRTAAVQLGEQKYSVRTSAEETFRPERKPRKSKRCFAIRCHSPRIFGDKLAINHCPTRKDSFSSYLHLNLRRLAGFATVRCHPGILNVLDRSVQILHVTPEHITPGSLGDRPGGGGAQYPHSATPSRAG